MESEIKALNENGTWELVEAPSDSDIIDCRWVYKLKKDADGKVKHKARLVARGFTQIYGENYWATYAPVVKSSTIRLLLACAVEYRLVVEQVDVRNAYVKSELKECIYMRQPYGFEDGSGKVCKLKKSLYGLKQAGHEWNKCINEFLEDELKFRRLDSDPCVYVKLIDGEIIIITIYVDDILIYGSSRPRINEFKKRLNEKFEIEDLGLCRKIIGIEVEQDSDVIKISQRGFTEELLQQYKLNECIAERTPLNPSIELVCPEGNCDNCELVDSTKYRGIVGKLLYLAGSTRPDIAFAVSNLSRFNSKPHKVHLSAARHVLRYLSGTKGLGIEYRRTNDKMYGYSDADWANCKIDRRSYTGFIVYLAGGPIAWEARKQPTPAQSSSEAEYMAIASAARELMFCRNVLKEIGLGELCNGSMVLFSDNQGAIKLAKNVGFSSRTKHIDVKHHYIRHLVKRGIIVLEHVGTNEMVADVFTKALGPNKHRANMERFMIRVSH